MILSLLNMFKLNNKSYLRPNFEKQNTVRTLANLSAPLFFQINYKKLQITLLFILIFVLRSSSVVAMTD